MKHHILVKWNDQVADKAALPAYDNCAAHHEWKDRYSALIEKKAIFDCK